jgi:hypothetical protein
MHGSSIQVSGETNRARVKYLDGKEKVMSMAERQVTSDPTPLDFLRAVYCNEGLPLHVRMKAAIEAAPYVHPKLSATALLTSDDFATRLERAILRTGRTITDMTRALPEPE